MTRTRCYLDVEIENEPVGRITIELFNDICPITCENFRALCTGEKGIGENTHKPLCYKNTLFHRVVKGFVIQSGDFECNNGSGGESIYGGVFPDENFDLIHDRPLLLSMANRGKDTNGSQFFITLAPADHLDKKHTVFGRVISGSETIEQIENLKTINKCKPIKEVKIAQCGELVRRSEKRKKRRRQSLSSASSSTEEERKKRKKHKKERKKSKKEKKSKGFYSSSNKAEDEIVCNVDPDEIPAIPANNFLMRRTSPIGEFRRSPRRENYLPKRNPVSHTKSGRKVKGRGNMRYGEQDVPPHWKTEEAKKRKIDDVLKENNNRNSASEQSNEDNDDERPQNAFLQSRLGNFEGRRDDGRRDNDEDWRRRDSGRGLLRDKERNDKPGLFKKLIQDDERHGNSWFHHHRDQSDESPKSPLRSKVVKKSTESWRDSRSDRRGFDRENYRRYEENSWRRDSPSERRSKNFHRDSSSGRENSYRKSDHRNESKKETETNKNLNEKKIEPPKKLPIKSRKRLNLLENDLFRYAKDLKEDSESPERVNTSGEKAVSHEKINTSEEKAVSHEKINTSGEKAVSHEKINTSRANVVKKVKKSKKRLNLLENDLFRYAKDLREEEESPEHTSGENEVKIVNQNEAVLADSINSVHSSNNVPAELPNHGLEKDTVKEKETVSERNIVQSHESQYSDVSSRKVPEFESEKELENNLSVDKLGTEFNQCRNSPLPIEEQIKDFKANKKLSSPSHDSTCSEDDKLQKHIERSREELKSIEAEENISNKKGNSCSLSPIIPLPDDDDDDELNFEAILGKKKIKKSKVADVQVTENLSADSSEAAARKQFRSKEKKHHRDNEKKSPCSPTLNLRRLDKKSYRASVSPRRSKSPLHQKVHKSKSSDGKKASLSRRSRSPVSRQSKSPPSKGKSSVFQRKVSNARHSKSRSRSRSARRSTSRNKSRRKYSRSPDIRQRRSRSQSHSRNIRRGNRSYRPSGMRNRSPEFKSSFQRRNRSPYRGRARGRSTSRRSKSRSRSHSVDKKRRHRRHVSSSSSSSTSSSGSSNIKRRKMKKKSAKSRNKRSSSSSSSTASSRSNRSNS